MPKKILVVGAGPAGCYFASRTENYDITIIEEHPEIGKPVQCAGIVSSEITKLLKIRKEFLVNTIDKARIYSPNGNYLQLKFKNPNYVIDRHKFDSFLAEQAEKKGVKILKSHKLIDINGKKVVVENDGTKKQLAFDKLIGADGPMSRTALKLGIVKSHHHKDFWTGMQARVKLKNDNAVEFYPYIGTYAWVIPESSEVVRIGVVGEYSVAETFNKFLSQRLPKNSKILDRQAGLIPKPKPFKKMQKNDTILLGDAAKQIKALTGGGLVPGLTAAGLLAESLSYTWPIRKKLSKNLFLNSLMRHVLDNFRDRDYNNLILALNEPKVKKILEETDRDYPSKYILKLILRKPSLLLYGSKLLKRKA